MFRAATTWNALPIGTNNYKLSSNGTIPVYTNPTISSIRADSTASVTHTDSDWVINLTSASAQTLTLLAASSMTGRRLIVMNGSGVAKSFSASVFDIAQTSATSSIAKYTVIEVISNGIGWFKLSSNSYNVNQGPNVYTFNSSGTYTPSAYCKYIEIECVGGGGGSPSLTPSAASGFTVYSFPGRSGAYARVKVEGSALSTSHAVTVGLGGNGMSSGGFSAVAGIVSCPGGISGTFNNVRSDTSATPGVYNYLIAPLVPTITLGSAISTPQPNALPELFIFLSPTESVFSSKAGCVFDQQQNQYQITQVVPNFKEGSNGAPNSGTGAGASYANFGTSPTNALTGGSGFVRIIEYV
jgi:hypothetical protein